MFASKQIVFTTWGSFGDVHPFMALAIELRRQALDWGKSHRSVEELRQFDDDAPYTMDDVFKLLGRE